MERRLNLAALKDDVERNTRNKKFLAQLKEKLARRGWRENDIRDLPMVMTSLKTNADGSLEGPLWISTSETLQNDCVRLMMERVEKTRDRLAPVMYTITKIFLDDFSLVIRGVEEHSVQCRVNWAYNSVHAEISGMTLALSPITPTTEIPKKPLLTDEEQDILDFLRGLPAENLSSKSTPLTFEDTIPRARASPVRGSTPKTATPPVTGTKPNVPPRTPEGKVPPNQQTPPSFTTPVSESPFKTVVVQREKAPVKPNYRKIFEQYRSMTPLASTPSSRDMGPKVKENFLYSPSSTIAMISNVNTKAVGGKPNTPVESLGEGKQASSIVNVYDKYGGMISSFDMRSINQTIFKSIEKSNTLMYQKPIESSASNVSVSDDVRLIFFQSVEQAIRNVEMTWILTIKEPPNDEGVIVEERMPEIEQRKSTMEELLAEVEEYRTGVGGKQISPKVKDIVEKDWTTFSFMLVDGIWTNLSSFIESNRTEYVSTNDIHAGLIGTIEKALLSVPAGVNNDKLRLLLGVLDKPKVFLGTEPPFIEKSMKSVTAREKILTTMKTASTIVTTRSLSNDDLSSNIVPSMYTVLLREGPTEFFNHIILSQVDFFEVLAHNYSGTTNRVRIESKVRSTQIASEAIPAMKELLKKTKKGIKLTRESLRTEGSSLLRDFSAIIERKSFIKDTVSTRRSTTDYGEFVKSIETEEQIKKRIYTRSSVKLPLTQNEMESITVSFKRSRAFWSEAFQFWAGIFIRDIELLNETPYLEAFYSMEGFTATSNDPKFFNSLKLLMADVPFIPRDVSLPFLHQQSLLNLLMFSPVFRYLTTIRTDLLSILRFYEGQVYYCMDYIKLYEQWRRAAMISIGIQAGSEDVNVKLMLTSCAIAMYCTQQVLYFSKMLRKSYSIFLHLANVIIALNNMRSAMMMNPETSISGWKNKWNENLIRVNRLDNDSRFMFSLLTTRLSPKGESESAQNPYATFYEKYIKIASDPTDVTSINANNTVNVNILLFTKLWTVFSTMYKDILGDTLKETITLYDKKFTDHSDEEITYSGLLTWEKFKLQENRRLTIITSHVASVIGNLSIASKLEYDDQVSLLVGPKWPKDLLVERNDTEANSYSVSYASDLSSDSTTDSVDLSGDSGSTTDSANISSTSFSSDTEDADSSGSIILDSVSYPGSISAAPTTPDASNYTGSISSAPEHISFPDVPPTTITTVVGDEVVPVELDWN
ncbi:MAG: hypothetical protein JSS82_03985 [Bacteroidetes bacterium]|nr:hypothetical protein [Bacteroidota bacterium]